MEGPISHEIASNLCHFCPPKLLILLVWVQFFYKDKAYALTPLDNREDKQGY